MYRGGSLHAEGCEAQVDVGYSPLSDREDQIIRVWSILSDHKEVLPALFHRNPPHPPRAK
jgi:hypothetical protein